MSVWFGFLDWILKGRIFVLQSKTAEEAANDESYPYESYDESTVGEHSDISSLSQLTDF